MSQQQQRVTASDTLKEGKGRRRARPAADIVIQAAHITNTRQKPSKQNESVYGRGETGHCLQQALHFEKHIVSQQHQRETASATKGMNVKEEKLGASSCRHCTSSSTQRRRNTASIKKDRTRTGRSRAHPAAGIVLLAAHSVATAPTRDSKR